MSETQSPDKSQLTAAIIRRLIQVSIFLLIQAAVLFWAAGRWDWIAAWVYLGLYVALMAYLAATVLPKNPEMIAERSQIKADAKRWDIGLATLIGAILPLVTLLIAGLDVRFDWSPKLGHALQSVFWIVTVLGYGLTGWAMTSNQFFSGVVRIQKDRGHTVVTAGPYQYVRHPGYAGMIVFSFATPLFLGSLLASIPGIITAGLIVVRTALEDRTLLDELDGYKDYAARVPYRLAPDIW